jgi:hypothetical protein
MLQHVPTNFAGFSASDHWRRGVEAIDPEKIWSAKPGTRMVPGWLK